MNGASERCFRGNDVDVSRGVTRLGGLVHYTNMDACITMHVRSGLRISVLALLVLVGCADDGAGGVQAGATAGANQVPFAGVGAPGAGTGAPAGAGSNAPNGGQGGRQPLPVAGAGTPAAGAGGLGGAAGAGGLGGAAGAGGLAGVGGAGGLGGAAGAPAGGMAGDAGVNAVPGQLAMILGINVGGPATTYMGNQYIADRFATGGSSRTVTNPISGTDEDTLFQSERYGSYTYEIPVSEASYNISLHFAELYQQSSGARSFDVMVEGVTLFTQMDLYSVVGAFTAYTEMMQDIQVTDGFLTIEVLTLVDNGTLCGIEIWSKDGEYVVPPPPEPGTASAEDTGYDCQLSSPSGPNGGSSSVLPDPFTRWDGAQVQTMEDWRCRRRELVVEVEKLILGEKAPPPASIGGSVTGSVSQSGYSVDVQTPGGSASFNGTISLPSSGSAPYPAVIIIGGFNSLNGDVLDSEGVATMSYNNNSIAAETAGNFTTGIYYDANPEMRGVTGALVAWAWGISRIIDVLEQNPDVIDPTKIAVHGCSRLGKAAFVAGAFDQRIALGLPLEPGTGGPAPLRALPVLGGQSLASANGEASWFGPTSGSYSSSMPVDMSDVATMYAPRGLLMMDNPHIDHLAYKANYLGSAAAHEVYTAMGRADALWYLGSTGNGTHCAVRSEYAGPLRAMIQKFLKDDGSATTGGLDTHANHGNIDVSSWTSTWNKGTISQ